MLARWWTFGVWALVAGSAFFWGLRIFVQAPAVPRDTVVAQPGGGLRGDLTRLFGADAPPPPPPTAEPVAAPDPRFVLVGVLSPRSPGAAREGVALIAIDGSPAKAYRVGQVVDNTTVLQSVNARGAQLGPRGGPALVALELAPLPPAATGSLPSIGGPGGAGAPGIPQPGPGRPMGAPPGMAGIGGNPVMQQPTYNDVQVQQQPDPAQAADTAALR